MATTTTLTYRCPFCGTSQEAVPAENGKQITCTNPECGKPFQVSAPTAAPVRTDDDEHELMAVRLDAFRRHPFRAGVYGFGVLAGLCGMMMAAQRGSTFWLLVFLVIGGYTAFRLGVWWARIHNTVISITNRRIRATSGLFVPESIDVTHDQIRDVVVHQTLQNQQFNVGDLAIAFGSPDNERKLLIIAVPDPDAVAALIREHAPAQQPDVSSKQSMAESTATVG